MLEHFREEIDKIDEEIIKLFARRQEVSYQIGKYKKEHNLPVVDLERKELALEKRVKIGEQAGLSKEDSCKIFEFLHKKSVEIQREV